MTLSGTALIVQMRLDSQRLHKKALLPIADTNLAGLVMSRLKKIKADLYILATDDAGAKALAETARKNDFLVFAGPKDDVLERFALVIQKYRPERVIRATGDNPFVSIPLAEQAILEADHADYVGILDMPIGMGVEVIRAEALLEAEKLAYSAYDREHVCPYLYNNPSIFVIKRPRCPDRYYMPNARLTVDTASDFNEAKAIVADLGAQPDDMAIINWLKNKVKMHEAVC